MKHLLFAALIAPLLPGIALAQQGQPAAISRICGPLSGQTFKCPELGFVYTVTFGWVDRTAEMSGPEMSGPATSESSAGSSAAQRTSSRTLLAVFERPPDAPGEGINSAVVIAAESLKNYPGIKSAADYFGPVTELAQQRGFKAEGEPYEFAVGPKELVRDDYSKPRGPLTMFQSTLAMIEKGQIISFTFVGGSEDEVDQLIQGLKFAVAAGKAAGK